ncbi:hypothetical protein BN59_03805 [Legionella massiliensis]|uniref:Uncharacterized protein n=1 Tax=Legionella massiliensis TaxID=1034943 RepID=A0A078L2P5_9GAMM|nr:hypothetical protein [Legionella massiliensis]CDZ79487.1 hypothetical protein BN59_03805 [Legionella massiliensis]CEE15225.1 hypothetical protein BN1094_03805 [Legionella massiliensis]
MNKKTILQDHKKKGRKLIPPIMQLENIHEYSFIDNTLPSLIWMSALILRAEEKEAVNKIIDFIKICDETINNGEHFAFLSSFYKLDKNQKKIILKKIDEETVVFFQNHLAHHYYFFEESYPLDFIFNATPDLLKEKALQKLMDDVNSLLDRFSQHSTIVQTTAYVSLLITGKVKISNNIIFPNPDIIFTSPASDEAKRVSSHVRAALNVIPNFNISDDDKADNEWANLFWKKAFKLKGCM